MDLISQALWAVAPGIIVGLVTGNWNRRQKERDKQAKAIEAERIRSEKLKLSLLVASAQLSYATAMAMKRGSTNGEVEPAVKRYYEAMEAFRSHEQEQVAKMDN